MKRWILVGCIVFLLAATAYADPLRHLGGKWKWWKDPKIKSELKLSEDQMTRIRELIRSKRDHLIDLRAAMEKKAFLLGDEIEKSDYDLSKALAAAEEVMKARNELARARMALLLELRGLLEQEQYLKLRAIGEKRRVHFLRRFHGKGEGPREGLHH